MRSYSLRRNGCRHGCTRNSDWQRRCGSGHSLRCNSGRKERVWKDRQTRRRRHWLTWYCLRRRCNRNHVGRIRRRKQLGRYHTRHRTARQVDGIALALTHFLRLIASDASLDARRHKSQARSPRPLHSVVGFLHLGFVLLNALLVGTRQRSLLELSATRRNLAGVARNALATLHAPHLIPNIRTPLGRIRKRLPVAAAVLAVTRHLVAAREIGLPHLDDVHDKLVIPVAPLALKVVDVVCKARTTHIQRTIARRGRRHLDLTHAHNLAALRLGVVPRRAHAKVTLRQRRVVQEQLHLKRGRVIQTHARKGRARPHRLHGVTNDTQF